ncbi:hypothetical protein WN55_10530 [Dufourea novaeangliae]|uniref:Uncharacterized protein n=1 Tax=Dufourea novaeangliae TaxID=178035 RepID=A0A154P3V0_DUFNO|nr:hypothetical protein WN55_10530 [Dufourea novaeangliae]
MIDRKMKKKKKIRNKQRWKGMYTIRQALSFPPCRYRGRLNPTRCFDKNIRDPTADKLSPEPDRSSEGGGESRFKVCASLSSDIIIAKITTNYRDVPNDLYPFPVIDDLRIPFARSNHGCYDARK